METQKWKLRCRYTWKISVNKDFFQIAGKKKTPDFMPNGIVGTNFGQGLPPVKVNWKKNWRNWQRPENDFLQGGRKLAISRSIFFVKAPQIHQRTPNILLNKTCLLQRGARSNPIWEIGRQSQKIVIFANLGPKIAILVNKVVDLGKTSAGQSS